MWTPSSADEEAQDEIEYAAVEVARAEEVAQLREWVDDDDPDLISFR